MMFQQMMPYIIVGIIGVYILWALFKPIKTIYIEPQRSKAMMLKARSILARLPGFALIAIVVYLFYQDPIWPYHLVTHPLVLAFFQILTDPIYRTWWAEHWMPAFIVILSLAIILTVAFKMAIWNKAFKILVIRTRDEQDKIETEVGRAYWIEGWSGQGALRLGSALLRGLHIMDIKTGWDPKKQYRTVKRSPTQGLVISRADDKIDWVYKETSLRIGEKGRNVWVKNPERTIFYKATFWPPINIIAPHRSMHRLIIALPNDAINVYDGTMIMVDGRNLERDLTEDYPTFRLTNDANEFVELDLDHYKDEMDKNIQKATYTTNIASQMDTFLLKDQRKFQEISVPVNPLMAKLEKERRKATGGS